MVNIKVADMTLSESEQVYSARLSFKEKLETAKLLEKLRADIIETGPVSDAPADSAFIRTLASTLDYSAICVPVTLDKKSVDTVWSALSKAKRPRLNIIVPTSTVQMEYGNRMKAETMLPLVGEITAYCAGICADVEFTASDATRSEPEFLAAVLRAAISGGAKTVTLCDSVGELLPEELSAFIEGVYEAVPEMSGVTLSLLCKDALGLASAAVLAGISAGARQVKVSSGGKSGTLQLEQFLNVLKVRGETLGITSGINDTALRRTCAQLAALSGSGAKEHVLAADAAGKPDEAALPEDADADMLRSYIISLGYEVSEDDLSRIYSRFADIARNKKVVSRDIEALIAETAGQAAAVYAPGNYVINSGSSITATAYVEILKEGAVKTALSAGDGPIDAAFRASEQILGSHYELEEFQIQAVTGGREATGDALVKLRHRGKLYSGRGVSTDIIGASIRAYLSAVNKIVNEERVI